MDPDELAEPGAVVVPHRLGVAPRLQHRVSLQIIIIQTLGNPAAFRVLLISFIPNLTNKGSRFFQPGKHVVPEVLCPRYNIRTQSM